MALLNDNEIAAALPAGWEHAGDEIRKDFDLETFPAAVAFVNRVADAAEVANHHPDIDIRYNRVLVALSTHSEGGVTDKDLSLAAQVEELAPGAEE